MLQGLRRRSVEVDRRDVTHVTDIFPTLRSGVVPAGGEITEASEEVLSGLELLLDRCLATDVVRDRALLRFCEVGEILLEATLGFSIEPIQAIGDDRTII